MWRNHHANLQVPKLTPNERKLLVQLIRIVEANEWSAGDYCLTQRQFDALQNAKAKLEK